jgi:ribosomal protein L29
MSETAATSAPAVASATPAPAAATDSGIVNPSAPAVDDTPPAEAGLEEHVQHALKAGKRKESAKQAAETKAANKGKKPAPPAPVKVEPAVESDEPEAEPEPTEKPARSGKTARQLLEAGDLEGAFEEAFGKKPADFNINSKRWAEYRQVMKRDRAKVEQRERQVAQNFEQYNQLIARAKDEVKPFIAMRQAKQLYESGDLEGAIKLAFGDDVTGFNKRLLGQFHSKSPEVDATRAELKALKDELLAERQQYQQQLAQQHQAEQQRQDLATIARTIEQEGDAQLAAFAKNPKRLGRIYQILAQHYDHDLKVTIPIMEAADMARREILDEFGDVLGPRDAGAPAVSGRGGSTPAKQVPHGTRTISQNGAAETSAPPRGAHGKSLDEQVREIERQFGQAS